MQIITYIQLIVIYNSTAHISVSIWFFIEVKNLHKNFLPWLFPDLLTNSLTFPDRVETLPLLVGGNSEVTNQELWFFMNTTVNFTYFLGATRNSICSWENVMTFYFYAYPLYPFASHLVPTTCKLTPFQIQLVSVLNSLSQK